MQRAQSVGYLNEGGILCNTVCLFCVLHIYLKMVRVLVSSFQVLFKFIKKKLKKYKIGCTTARRFDLIKEFTVIFANITFTLTSASQRQSVYNQRVGWKKSLTFQKILFVYASYINSISLCLVREEKKLKAV